MIQLELTAAEQQILVGVLESYLSDLRMEIADTDRKDFREMLKARKQVVMKVLEALQESRPVAPVG